MDGYIHTQYMHRLPARKVEDPPQRTTLGEPQDAFDAAHAAPRGRSQMAGHNMAVRKTT